METNSPITDDPSILALLRSATRLNHQRAENAIGLPQTLVSHLRTLKTFYGFLEPWEAAVFKTLQPMQSELQGRRKTPLLVEDLKNLGLSENDLAVIPRCNRLPLFHDIPTALGSMYVFEGATLGGQLLSRHVEQQLGLRDGTGYCFYQSYGSAVGTMWREFGQLLTKNSPHRSFDAVIQSARDTFDLLCDFFDLQNRAS